MKKPFLSLLLLLFVVIALAQSKTRSNSLRISVGRVVFGTGDVIGYSFSNEFAKSIGKHIWLSSEFAIENGKRQPRVVDIFRSFNQVSNISLTTKINYYPFNKIVKGFNIGVGPVLGYQWNSREAQWTTLFDANGNPYLRRSILNYNNGFIIGYKVSLNYDFAAGKAFLIGLRADFSNYNNGDINTLAALKFGYNF